MVRANRKRPGSGNKTGCDNELSFVSQTGVGLFTLWQITIQKLIEDGWVRNNFVVLVNLIADFADSTSQIL